MEAMDISPSVGKKNFLMKNIFLKLQQNAVRVDLKQCQFKNYEEVILDESNISANEIKDEESDNEKNWILN